MVIKTGNESMALTGQYSTVLSKEDDMGPFSKAHVLIIYIVSFCLYCVLT
jgi:hypothetical protein